MQYFYDHYFKPQNVVPMNRVFSKEHIIISSLIVITIVWIMQLQRKKQNREFSRKLLTGLGILMLSLEIFRISWRTYYFGFDLRNLRFDWCNQICMFLPFVAIFQIERLYPYIDLAAIGGGALVLLYPLWVFYDYAGIHVMAVQSMISHGLMVLIGFTMPMASKTNYRRHPKNTVKAVKGAAVILIVACIMSNLLNENYLLMKSAEGIPVLENIPYPYYWLLALPLMVLALFVGECVLWHTDRYNLKLPKAKLLKEKRWGNQS